MTQPDPVYIANNRRIAERLLILLQRRGLLQDRISDEDQEHCRRSADDLRRVFEAEMLLVEDGGFLLDILAALQRACTVFVRAAGPKAKSFKQDDELFRYHLVVLREVFAKHVGQVVDVFGLTVTPEIQAILRFRS